MTNEIACSNEEYAQKMLTIFLDHNIFREYLTPYGYSLIRDLFELVPMNDRADVFILFLGKLDAEGIRYDAKQFN